MRKAKRSHNNADGEKPCFVGKRIASLEPRLAYRNSLDDIAFNVGHHEGKGDKHGAIVVTNSFLWRKQL